MRMDILDMAEAAVPEDPGIMFFARIVKIHSSKWEEGGASGMIKKYCQMYCREENKVPSKPPTDERGARNQVEVDVPSFPPWTLNL